MASVDGSHDGAPTKNNRKRTKPPKAGVLALHLANWCFVLVVVVFAGKQDLRTLPLSVFRLPQSQHREEEQIAQGRSKCWALCCSVCRVDFSLLSIHVKLVHRASIVDCTALIILGDIPIFCVDFQMNGRGISPKRFCASKKCSVRFQPRHLAQHFFRRANAVRPALPRPRRKPHECSGATVSQNSLRRFLMMVARALDRLLPIDVPR